MELTTEKIGDVTVVVLPGEQLDASNAKEFKRDIAPLLEPRGKVVFDLAELRFVDSSGLGAFLSFLRQLNAKGGDLKLCGMTKPVRALFELVRMHKIFDICGTKDERSVPSRNSAGYPGRPSAEIAQTDGQQAEEREEAAQIRAGRDEDAGGHRRIRAQPVQGQRDQARRPEPPPG